MSHRPYWTPRAWLAFPSARPPKPGQREGKAGGSSSSGVAGRGLIGGSRGERPIKVREREGGGRDGEQGDEGDFRDQDVLLRYLSS